MTVASRKPRPRVADEKNISEARAEPDITTGSLSPTDRLDCEALVRAIEHANIGRTGRNKLSDPKLARIAGTLGGSKYASQWWRYRHGVIAIPLIDKMIIAMEFNRRPQDLFPSWRWSALTLLPPGLDAGIERLVRILIEMPLKERITLLWKIDAWLKAKPAADPMPKRKKRA